MIFNQLCNMLKSFKNRHNLNKLIIIRLKTIGGEPLCVLCTYITFTCMLPWGVSIRVVF